MTDSTMTLRSLGESLEKQANLQPFSGKRGSCPKCQTEGASIEHCFGWREVDADVEIPFLPTGCGLCNAVFATRAWESLWEVNLRSLCTEHMCRVCSCCSYTWGELPLDWCSPLVQLAACAEEGSEKSGV